MTELQKKQILNMRKDGKGYKAIASAVGLSRDIVRNFCKSNNMADYCKVTKLNTEERIKLGELCINCFTPIKQPSRGRRRKFCSDECRHTWWSRHQEMLKKRETALYHLTCEYCGKEFISYGNKGRKYCSHNCYIHDRFWRKEEGRL